MADDAVMTVDAGARKVARRVVLQVTEVFDYSTARSPKMLELLGQPAVNAGGITKTLQALATRFG